MTSQSFTGKQLHVYEIPYTKRKDVCRILDLNDDWKELGGSMKYSTFEIQEIENESRRCGSSPTENLLTRWGHCNHRVLELFVLLYKMEHRPAMEAIKELVDPVYHKLLQYKMKTGSTGNNGLIRDSSNNIGSMNNIMVPLHVQYIEEGKKIQNSSKVQNGAIYEASETSNETRSDASSRIDGIVAESAGALLRIPYAELSTATANWDAGNILGKGGFGVVYKGDWKHTAVAIKRLKSQTSNGGVSAESLRELQYLNTCRHDNVLPLYGYSTGGEETCLVYQLMPGGSLEERLKCRDGKPPLLWRARLNIAQGVAKGLQYLHTLSVKPLIHGDIKSANILLDSCGEPRIGDFGLAREGPDMGEHTHLKVSRVHGTRPYLPDEFLRGKRLSTKVDVYSFGVVIFELLTGLPAYDSRKQKFLKDYVFEYCTENSSNRELVAIGLQDSRLLEINEGCPELGEKLIFVGLKCVQNKPQDRPDMVSVWQELMLIQIPAA